MNTVNREEAGCSWYCTDECKTSHTDSKCVAITSIVLIILTAVAAYFCISYGLKYLDTARSGLQKFGGGFLVYSGAAFSLFGIVNMVRIVFAAEKNRFFENQHYMFLNYLTLLAPLSVPYLLIASSINWCQTGPCCINN